MPPPQMGAPQLPAISQGQAPTAMQGAQGGQQQMQVPPGMPPEQQVQQPPMQPPKPPDQQQQLEQLLQDTNIAEKLDEEQLKTIGKNAYEGYQNDLQSRRHWEDNLDKWTKLAVQVAEHKSYPWPNASNIKYPVLSTAAMQFNARAYPALVSEDKNLVKVDVIGEDPQGLKAARAERVSHHMSYQVRYLMPEWEEDMDRLLLILPIIGTVFKKTYWDSLHKVNRSKLVLPKDLVINYWSKSLESAERKTERIEMTARKIKERQLAKIFCDVDLKKPATPTMRRIDEKSIAGLTASAVDDTTPFIILEQHTFLDLDDDGYAEPYIVTIEERTRQVLRIVARFDMEGVHTDDKGHVTFIDPVEYYTKFSFIPNTEGGFYDIGFGLLLGSLNATIDTIINQLTDAGTLANLPAGFIAKGLRIKMGDTRLQPGEFKPVNATSDDLRKGILPLPYKEPSGVLYNLLGMLINSCKELSSIADIFTGKMPGQNTPATTTQSTIEQGMMVFTAIFKRVFRALTKEYQKMYRLNRIYYDPTEEENVLDIPITQDDYEDKSQDIKPNADPNATSFSEKYSKAQVIMQFLQMGTINPVALTKMLLQSMELSDSDVEALLVTSPPPSPQAQQVQQQMQLAQQQAQLDAQSQQFKNQLAGQKTQAAIQSKAQLAQINTQSQAQLADIAVKQKAAQAMMLLQQSAAQHQQTMQQSSDSHKLELAKTATSAALDNTVKDESHQQRMQQQSEAKPKPKE